MPKKKNSTIGRCPRCNQKMKENLLIIHMAKEHGIMPDNQTGICWNIYTEWLKSGRHIPHGPLNIKYRNFLKLDAMR